MLVFSTDLSPLLLLLHSTTNTAAMAETAFSAYPQADDMITNSHEGTGNFLKQQLAAAAAASDVSFNQHCADDRLRPKCSSFKNAGSWQDRFCNSSSDHTSNYIDFFNPDKDQQQQLLQLDGHSSSCNCMNSPQEEIMSSVDCTLSLGSTFQQAAATAASSSSSSSTSNCGSRPTVTLDGIKPQQGAVHVIEQNGAAAALLAPTRQSRSGSPAFLPLIRPDSTTSAGATVANDVAVDRAVASYGGRSDEGVRGTAALLEVWKSHQNHGGGYSQATAEPELRPGAPAAVNRVLQLRDHFGSLNPCDMKDSGYNQSQGQLLAQAATLDSHLVSHIPHYGVHSGSILSAGSPYGCCDSLDMAAQLMHQMVDESDPADCLRVCATINAMDASAPFARRCPRVDHLISAASGITYRSFNQENSSRSGVSTISSASNHEHPRMKMVDGRSCNFKWISGTAGIVPGSHVQHRNVARVCAQCKTMKTPLWRNGPQGPKSLCNACGIRYKKEEKRSISSLIGSSCRTNAAMASGAAPSTVVSTAANVDYNGWPSCGGLAPPSPVIMPSSNNHSRNCLNLCRNNIASSSATTYTSQEEELEEEGEELVEDQSGAIKLDHRKNLPPPLHHHHRHNQSQSLMSQDVDPQLNLSGFYPTAEVLHGGDAAQLGLKRVKLNSSTARRCCSHQTGREQELSAELAADRTHQAYRNHEEADINYLTCNPAINNRDDHALLYPTDQINYCPRTTTSSSSSSSSLQLVAAAGNYILNRSIATPIHSKARAAPAASHIDHHDPVVISCELPKPAPTFTTKYPPANLRLDGTSGGAAANMDEEEVETGHGHIHSLKAAGRTARSGPLRDFLSSWPESADTSRALASRMIKASTSDYPYQTQDQRNHDSRSSSMPPSQTSHHELLGSDPRYKLQNNSNSLTSW